MMFRLCHHPMCVRRLIVDRDFLISEIHFYFWATFAHHMERPAYPHGTE